MTPLLYLISPSYPLECPLPTKRQKDSKQSVDFEVPGTRRQKTLYFCFIFRLWQTNVYYRKRQHVQFVHYHKWQTAYEITSYRPADDFELLLFYYFYFSRPTYIITNANIYYHREWLYSIYFLCIHRMHAFSTSMKRSHGEKYFEFLRNKIIDWCSR